MLSPRRSRVAGSVVLLGGGALLARLVAFAGTAYMTRVLGPGGFGIIAIAFALSRYVALAVDGGVYAVGAREVAACPARAPALAAGVIMVRLLLALAAFATLGLVALVLDKPDQVRLVVFLSGLLYFALALDTSWVYKGLERNLLPSIALVLTEGVGFLFLLALVHGPEDVAFVPVALFGGQLMASFFLLVLFFRDHPFEIDLRAGFQLFRHSSYLIVSKLMRTLFYTFDVLMLGFFIGEQVVGLYAAGNRICFILSAISTALIFSYLPEFTRAAQKSPGHVMGVYRRALELTGVFAIPFVVGGGILAGPLMALLFGPPFEAGGSALRLLLLGIGFAAFRAVLGNVLLVYDRLRLDMLLLSISTGLNILLNVLLIPRFGLTGAATATAVAEGINLVLAAGAAWRLGVRPQLNPVAKSMVATGFMGAALVVAMPILPTGALVAGSAFVYFGALVLVGGVPVDARPYFRAMLARLRP